LPHHPGRIGAGRRQYLANPRVQQRKPRRIYKIQDSLAGERVRERYLAVGEFLAVHKPETCGGVERCERLAGFSRPDGNNGRYVPTVPEHGGDLQNRALTRYQL
jgi:hypothetical protein